MVLVAFHPTFHRGFQIKVLQYTATRYILITTETMAILIFSISIQLNVTGQHDRQEERLTGRYFEP